MSDNEQQPERNYSDPIFIIGFMGAGKTTMGRALARKLNWNFIDLDDLIEARAGKRIREIFAESGEGVFRSLEREALRSCGDSPRTVIALGGGAFLSEANRAQVRRAGKSVWLDCPFDMCLARIEGDLSRPLASSEDAMRALFESRRAYYATADFVIQTGTSSPEALADEIKKTLGL